MEEKNKNRSHSLIMNDRRSIVLTGITDVGCFDEDSIMLYTDLGSVLIKGEKLQVNNIDTESGNFEAEGKVFSVIYGDKKQKNQSFFSKVFR